eukprot:TRINITY_DN353620_c0_g1_i1.p1 TRINITY_DN353620_c0_g1~~TRINITY_DN353620_c0_g1_i1.p1  ORF type:complete len:243 (-),score=66.50 TRINITY_DN353620_c0_g1_i1:92-820(-)
MNDLKDKKVLIIGGASGFGFESAKMLLKKGADVKISSRTQEKLDLAIEELTKISPNIKGKVLDAANEDEIKRFFKTCHKFDYMISMAGGFMGGGFLDAEYETIKNAIDEKLFANMKIARYAADKIKDYGAMIFTAGSGGRADNASGAIIGNEAISTMARGLAVELSKRKIRVNAVAPTWTKTPLWNHMSKEQLTGTDRYFSETIPLGRTATIEEVSSAYVFLIENSFINGQTINVDGGLSVL